MAEATKKTAAAKPAAVDPEPSEAEAPPLARAAESSNPDVHRLMAERQTAVLNNNEEAIAAVDDELRRLGFTL